MADSLPASANRLSGAAHDASSAPDLARDLFDILGFVADVGAPPGEARAAVRSVLRGFGPVLPATSEPSCRFDIAAEEAPRWAVRSADEVLDRDKDFLVALGMLEWHLVSAALGHRADLFHLHGSALCLPMRREGLMLVGGSSRGKTTLTMGLMLRGFVPFADDVALIDPRTLELQALRRAFHVSEDTWRVLEPVAGALARDDDEVPGFFVPPQWAERPVPVRWLLLPEYRPRQTPELIPLSVSEAAAGIVEQTLSLERSPRMALATAARLTEQARCYRFLCGDLTDSIAMVQNLVGATASAASPLPRG